MKLSKTRSFLYRLARLLGDVNVVARGRPDRIAKRAVNKLSGRGVVRRMWWR